ncbi:uncharacterized protein A4U43_C03F20060 [Asparagus officinalis]|uniref:soluble epoxide hydrolase n=1 Tax=Asparagus officinalis TaxID=4686 RepID=A0A5P1FCC2_ASPOF|nr:uncharacterized protein LOC109832273 [Asparagus officinalis]ONK75742.1 uncharacterized protein A4U43_C03F20060 [Asparagus officinalis]
MEGETRHTRIQTNGIRMHVAEQGDPEGPVVLFIHGFPELWLSWKHQMSESARNGYRAIAPDLRGYGDTDSPPDPRLYTILHLVGDLIGLLDHLKVQQAFVVGHDWGASVAWHLCLFRPDRVRALVNLGVPYIPQSPTNKPSNFFQNFGDGFYINQFQEPGRAESSFARHDVSTVIKKFLSTKIPSLIAPSGMEIIDFLDEPSQLPSWLSEDELKYFANKFQKSGFTGPLNYYRMMDVNWNLLAPWNGAKICVPAKLIAGDKDIGFESFGTKDCITGDTFRNYVPNAEVVIIDGHHFLQQERAEKVTEEIMTFFNSITKEK